MNKSQPTTRPGKAEPPRLAFAFAVGTTVLLAMAGVWFTITAWADFDVAGHLIVAFGLVAGLAASVLATVFVWRRQWGWASLAALAAVLTPTGYAYVGNLLTLGVAVFAAVVFVRERTAARAVSLNAS